MLSFTLKTCYQSTAMNMELLLLLHEVERCRFLLSPLYVPSAGPSIPPLILGAVSTSSLLASPIGYLQALTQDILKYLFKLNVSHMYIIGKFIG
jgi:hypothetical protein